MSYPDLFQRAALLWWRTRLLWPLGILAALMGAGDYQTGNFNVSSNIPAGDDGVAGLPPELIEQWAASPLVRSLVENPLPILLGLGLIALLWLLISTLLGQLAHGAMIRVADVADQGYRASFGDGMRVAAARLLPLFLLSLLVALPILVLVVAISAVVFVFVTQLAVAGMAGSLDSPGGVFAAIGGLLLCLVPLILLMVLLGLVLGFFARIAQRACVIEGRGPLDSLRRAWALVRRNFGIALLNWVALLMLTSIFGLLATLPALALAIPAFFSFMRSGAIPWAALIGLLLYSFAVTVLIGGVLTSFNSALWTVLYRAFAAREGAMAERLRPAAGGS